MSLSTNFWFSGRKYQSQQKIAKKITHFKVQFCSKNFTHFSTHSTLWKIYSHNTAYKHISEKTFALHHFQTPKNCVPRALKKQMFVYSCKSSFENFCFRDLWSFYLEGDWLISFKQIANFSFYCKSLGIQQLLSYRHLHQ